jgi:hypothetical protein
MQCHNHPNAAAIENCARCQIALCGMCANFGDNEVLCEKCLKLADAEKFVARQKLQLERKVQALQSQTSAAEDAKPQKKRLLSAEQTQILIIISCFIIIGVQLLFFSRPATAPSSGENSARSLAITSLAQCLITFRQIGAILATGDMPAESLRCADSAAANIITRSGNDERISHPDPSIYGFSRLYVSRNNPEPTVID